MNRRGSPVACWFAFAFAASVLAGCASGMQAAIESVRVTWRGGGGTAGVKMDPNFAYLRVTRGRYAVLLWRGSMETTPEGPVEVYYSGDGEVIRLRDGRLVGVSGLPTEWTGVVDHAPAWKSVAAAIEPVSFVRIRDVRPGYRSGVRDELVLTRAAPPSRSSLSVLDPQALTWFEERMKSGAARASGVSEPLPPARYALDLSGAAPAVVYSEQCVAPDFCFTWQRWSAAIQQASAPKPATGDSKP